MKDRTQKILEMLTVRNRMEVSALAQRLGVSKVTIRKDLDLLEQSRLIKREHGFAVLRSRDDLNGRIAYHYEVKRALARRACGLVRDGETIMIESGSCCALFAEALTASKKGLAIITNSTFIARYIRGKSDFQVILLGGIFQPESQVLVGPMVRQCAENFCVDQLFIGIDGWSRRTGFTNSDQMRAQAVRDMALQAERVIVLTESEKFSRHGVVPLNLKEKIKTVVTDPNVSDALRGEFSPLGIELIVG